MGQCSTKTQPEHTYNHNQSQRNTLQNTEPMSEQQISKTTNENESKFVQIDLDMSIHSNIKTVEEHINHSNDNNTLIAKQKYNYESLPHMTHLIYFIVLYYCIKEYTIEPLQDLWIKLYNLCYNKMKPNKYIPTIYIDFKTGETPTNINNIFNMLFDEQFVNDLYKLKSVIKQFYYQYNPKCIEYKSDTKVESMFDILCNVLINDNDISMETVPHEYEAIIGYNRNQMTIVDGGCHPSCQCMESNVSTMSRSPSVKSPITPFAVFGFVKPKTSVIATVDMRIGVVATVGMAILGGNIYNSKR